MSKPYRESAIRPQFVTNRIYILHEMNSDNDYRPVIIDSGSDTIKAGFAGDNAPSSLFPNIIGRSIFAVATIGNIYKNEYIGNETLGKYINMRRARPMFKGNI